jgi:hypothetical protein
MKSRRRIGRPSFGYPRFAVPGECFETPTVPRNVTAVWTDATAPPLLGGGSYKVAASRSRRYTSGHGLPVRRNSCPATCILAVKATRKRRPYANVRLILAVAIHIRGTSGRSQPPRPNGRELPKAE